MDNCIFCKIISKEIPKEFIYESDTLVVFEDINPSADIHLLIVPKKHISGIPAITPDEDKLLIDVYLMVKQLVKQYNLGDNLYRVVVNGGKAQHIPHLHFHLLGGTWKKFV